MSPPGGGGDVGGATLGGAAPLDEASSSVGILLRLQGGGGEDVGGQPPELIGSGLVPVLFQLQTDQSERRKEERLMSRKQLFIINKCFIKCFLWLRPNTLIGPPALVSFLSLTRR